MERIGNKVSYIRKPLARRSFVSAGLLAAALVFFAAAVGCGYYRRGDAPLTAAGFGISSIATGGSALGYGIASFFEKEKNYILAKISTAASGTLVLIWLVMIVIAL